MAWRKKQEVCEELCRAADRVAAEADECAGGQATRNESRLPQPNREEVAGGRPMLEAARPLFRAALCGDVDAVRALLASGADVNARTSRGRSLLSVVLHTPGVERAAVPLLRRVGLSDKGNTAQCLPDSKRAQAGPWEDGAAATPGTAAYATHRWLCAFELYDLVLAVNPSALLALAGRQRAAAALGSHTTALLDATELLGELTATLLLAHLVAKGPQVLSARGCVHILPTFSATPR